MCSIIVSSKIGARVARHARITMVQLTDFAILWGRFDPPPLKWSTLMYGFLPEKEDHDAEEEAQAGRDCREVAAG